MKCMQKRWLFVVLVFAPVLSCARQSEQIIRHFEIQPIASPAAPGSGMPNLFSADDGTVYLSWIEDAGSKTVALKLATRTATGWSAPRTIAEGNNWFVNWADFPSLVALRDGTLAAHWLAKSSGGTYSYDVKIAFSADGGTSWSAPITPHTDGTPTEHGFVSMLPWQGDRLFAAWLDGRKFASSKGSHDNGGGEMTIRAATIAADGRLSDEAVLDERTCECCQTSAALLPGGVIVAYRDRSADEIRDIYVVRYQDGSWSEPQRVYADNWNIPGCPVNGPAIASLGNQVVIAWFSAQDQTPQVKAVFSKDAGNTFSEPIKIDDGDPIGRVDVELLEDGSALVSWMEYSGDDGAIKLRQVTPDGRTGPAWTVATTGSGRASGFPRMARTAYEVVIAWTQTGKPAQVRTAVIPLSGKQ